MLEYDMKGGLNIEKIQSVAVWLVEQVDDGDLIRISANAYTSYDKAMALHKDFVEDEEDSFKKRFGENGYVREDDGGEDYASVELYVGGEYCMNHSISRVEIQELDY
jgi:hypothetical protein